MLNQNRGENSRTQVQILVHQYEGQAQCLWDQGGPLPKVVGRGVVVVFLDAFLLSLCAYFTALLVCAPWKNVDCPPPKETLHQHPFSKIRRPCVTDLLYRGVWVLEKLLRPLSRRLERHRLDHRLIGCYVRRSVPFCMKSQIFNHPPPYGTVGKERCWAPKNTPPPPNCSKLVSHDPR